MVIGRTLRAALMAAAIATGAATTARAEHLSIDIKVFGMDCATCAHGLTVAMKKLEGVESVDISLTRSSAEVRLRPGNRVTVDDLRRIVKRNGFTPKEAVVTTVAVPVRRNGRLALEVSGQPTVVAIATAGSTPAALESLTQNAAKGVTLIVAGTLSQKADGTEDIVVAGAKPRP